MAVKKTGLLYTRTQTHCHDRFDFSAMKVALMYLGKWKNAFQLLITRKNLKHASLMICMGPCFGLYNRIQIQNEEK